MTHERCLTSSGPARSALAVTFTAKPTALPIISTTNYDTLLAANGVILVQGRGSILVEITRGGTPDQGAKAVVVNAEGVSKYDANSATIWADISTGAKGMAWMPNNAIGIRTVTATPSSGAAANKSIEIFDTAITFETVAFP